MADYTPIEKYKKEPFAHVMSNGKEANHDIYSFGNHKKVVIIIQELPGIEEETLKLAQRFIDKEYTVVLPHLLGPLGKKASVQNMVRVMCMWKEFKVFAKHESSPVVDYLAALCLEMKNRYQVRGVAVIGMCLTGNFAISLMANDAVLAAYAGQPSLPFGNKDAFHMSAEETAAVKTKLDEVGPMHCASFEEDKWCGVKRIAAIRKAFNTDDKERIIFHKLPGKAHAILTHDFCNEEGHPTKKVFNEVLEYFEEQLALNLLA